MGTEGDKRKMIKKLLKKILPKSVFEETEKLTSRTDFDEGPVEYMEIYEIVPPLTERIKDLFFDWSPASILILWGIFITILLIAVGILGTVGIL